MNNIENPNNGGESSDKKFDLFAPNTQDNLPKELAKGSYKWTNKYTAFMALLLIIAMSGSAGVWYGQNHSSNSSNPAGNLRSAFARTGAGATAGAAGGGFGGGGFGGRGGTPATVTSIKGNTITVKASPTSLLTLKAGDAVTLRVSGAGGAGGAGRGKLTNPSFIACMKTEGVIVDPAAGPNRQDPKAATAIQTCMTKLGITFGGGGTPGGGTPTNP